MKLKILILVFNLSFTMSLFGQNEPINQFDSKGKKQGKWVEYLNDKWKTVMDSNKATYYYYNYYEQGISIYYIDNKSRINCKLESPVGSQQINKRLKLLDGNYIWTDKKGRTISISKFDKGEIISLKDYSWPFPFNSSDFFYRKRLTGKLHYSYDFKRKYHDQQHTYYFEWYLKHGSIMSYYWRNGEVGWGGYFETFLKFVKWPIQ